MFKGTEDYANVLSLTACPTTHHAVIIEYRVERSNLTIRRMRISGRSSDTMRFFTKPREN